MIKKIYFLAAASLLLVLGGCNSDELAGGGTSTHAEGEATLALSNFNVTSGSTGGQFSSEVDLTTFKVQVLTPDGSVYRSYKNYTTMPTAVRLKEGSYVMAVSSGDTQKVAFDNACYYGEAPFSISPQQNTQVNVLCKPNNVKVGVFYSDNFKNRYTDYKVLMVAPSDKRLTFEQQEERAAYAPEGNFRFKVYFTDAGIAKTYIPPTIKDSKAGEFVRLNLDASFNGDLTISISKDESTNDHDILIELPPFWLPKPAPTISFNGTSNMSVSSVEGVSAPAKVEITAPGDIRECLLKITSAELISRGWPQEVDLTLLEPSMADFLKSEGLVWSEITDVKQATIDFAAVLPKLHANEASERVTPFTISVRDAFDQVNEASTFNVITTLPIFSLREAKPEDAWACKAYLTADVTAGNPALISVQRLDNGTWTNNHFTNDYLSESVVLSCAAGLQPSTEYTLRVVYNGNRYSNAVTLTTEDDIQIVGGDFENWTNREVFKKKELFWGGASIQEYYPFNYNSGQTEADWWSTHNPLTTSGRGSFSAFYRSYTGTINVTGHSGKAAEIATVAWGDGNTWIEGSNWDDKSSGEIQNVTAGTMFIGRYNLGSRTDELGVPFLSRPTSVKFFYKFRRTQKREEPFGAYAIVENRATDGTITELGRATIDEATAMNPVGEFTEHKMEFVYTNRNLKATHISIVFLSANCALDGNSVATVRGSVGAFGGYHDYKRIGNVLTVDDVSVEY